VWGERTAGAAEAAEAAGVAVGKRTAVEQRCQRCCGDMAVVVVSGHGEIVRRHRATESSVREIGGDGDDAGVEAVVSWP
jgi:hypothetical protein